MALLVVKVLVHGYLALLFWDQEAETRKRSHKQSKGVYLIMDSSQQRLAGRAQDILPELQSMAPGTLLQLCSIS